MPSTKDTFNSKTTTPFERRPGRRDTFGSQTTTPFERLHAPRESRRDVDDTEGDAVGSELRSQPHRPMRWLLVIACLGALAWAAVWSTGLGY